ncbi:DUF5336 domain-containing protein [Streptomyces tsukubensis]|uniref:Uncharacterized protein n=1 Tax=Streptomyces tsukubensis TaxID=83656 RepID=A0A1V4A618_9ACTN|nr:DUF5336 domain-containing protein [Streptomyces tsukubensis]OON76705.1 hypothetical protein B1H18_20560 [Streptomyces tsukubensis]QFR93326.1 hypothetical protein GBW32_09790 [Streptomyces tsukubensis]
MNIRSLTRGDGVVIGAAVLLFIASFLATLSVDGASGDIDLPNAWDNLGLVMGVYVAGIIGAALIVLSRVLPQPRKVAGLELGQFGVALTVFSAWTAFWSILDATGVADDSRVSAGIGLILGLIAALVLAAAAVATPLVPALKAALISAPRPAAPQPYGGQPPTGYGYPGQQQPGAGYGYPGQPQQGQQPPYGQQPSQGGAHPHGQQPPQPAAATPQPAAEFAPFWFAVPVPRSLYGEDGAPTPIAELAPGTWYLAIEQRGPGLVVQTPDGRRGVLQDTTGIQRG